MQSVSWNDAVQFCNWLSHHEGLDPCYTRTGQVWEIPTGNFEEWVLNMEADGYRLPTEAEWEYACRAGIATQDPLRDEVNTLLLTVYGAGRTPVSTVSGNAGFAAEAVGTKPPDGWGLFDLNGNVHEWCNDWYERHIGLERGVEDSITDPMGPEKNDGRLESSDSWRNFLSSKLSAYGHRATPRVPRGTRRSRNRRTPCGRFHPHQSGARHRPTHHSLLSNLLIQ